MEFNVFKTISIGGLTKALLINQLVESGVQFNEYAKILFEHSDFCLNDKIEDVKLVKVKISDLGVMVPCSFQEIVIQASAFGLKLCPLYLGAFLRLQYLDQSEGPYLTVASTKPEKDENYPAGFYLRNFDNSLWLRGYHASDDYEWKLSSEFVFIK